MGLGMADDGTGLEQVVEPWCAEVVPKLVALCHADSPAPPPAAPPKAISEAEVQAGLLEEVKKGLAAAKDCKVLGPLSQARGILPIGDCVPALGEGGGGGEPLRAHKAMAGHDRYEATFEAGKVELPTLMVVHSGASSLPVPALCLSSGLSLACPQQHGYTQRARSPCS